MFPGPVRLRPLGIDSSASISVEPESETADAFPEARSREARSAGPSADDNPVATRHPDFVCIAAANTWGRGADREYVGRNELDASTIDRFLMGTVPMDYDESLERQLCPDAQLYERLRGYRERIRQNRLERIVSTRFIAQAYVKRNCCGWSDERIDSKLFQSWREDEVRKVKGGV